MSLLQLVDNDEVWREFLSYKLDANRLTEKEKKYFTDYITNRSYKSISTQISGGHYTFGIPVKKSVNKTDSAKKRVVYTYNEDETMVLKLLTFLLYKYDDVFCPNLFSFRKNSGVKKAFYSITDKADIDNFSSYKIDISDYFNSIDIPLLLDVLKPLFSDDIQLYDFFRSLLENDKVMSDGEIICEKKGVMAGVPVSSFLANVYLKEMDEYFYDKGITYARYSDDIIIFDYPEKIIEHKAAVGDFLRRYKLILNPDKIAESLPYEEWSFLGFRYKSGRIDISGVSLAKIKGKIKRQARKLRRWMLKNDAVYERALWAMNKKFNRKFYRVASGDELSWSRWYFPVINTDDSLKKIDMYMQENLRCIVTGKHNKKNYELVPYEKLKECGYKPLVGAYYDFIGDNGV